jgi:predicted Zn-dependent peptidase
MLYGSEFAIVATAQSGHTAAELEQAIDEELARLDSVPPSDSELERARAFVQTKLLHDLEGQVQLAGALAYFEMRFGDAAALSKHYLARYDVVPLSSLTLWAKKVLKAPRLTIEIDPEAAK